MSSVWNDVRAGWDTALGAVRDSDSAPGGETGATRERRLRLGRNPIAITGQPGSGKTLLYDSLTGSVRNGDPAKPRSHDWEKRRMTLQCGARRAQASVIVVPGQESSERERALDTIMSDTSAPQGIIHVVCWGHNKTWDQQAQLAIEDELRGTAEGLTQNSVRALHLADEADDFRKLRDKIMIPADGAKLERSLRETEVLRISVRHARRLLIVLWTVELALPAAALTVLVKAFDLSKSASAVSVALLCAVAACAAVLLHLRITLPLRRRKQQQEEAMLLQVDVLRETYHHVARREELDDVRREQFLERLTSFGIESGRKRWFIG